MSSNDKIIPKWGRNRYKLAGCTSFEFLDPEWQELLPTSLIHSSQESRNFTELLNKLGNVKCYHCKHLDTNQCLNSRQKIQEIERDYKKMKKKLKCYYCNSRIVLFHEFLFNYQDGIYVCTTCALAKEVGALKEDLKDDIAEDLKLNLFGILKCMIGSIFSILPLLYLMIAGIFGEDPPYWIVMLSFLLIFGILLLISFNTKKRRRKRCRLSELG